MDETLLYGSIISYRTQITCEKNKHQHNSVCAKLSVTEQLPPFHREIQAEEMWLYKFHRVEQDHVPTSLMFVSNISTYLLEQNKSFRPGFKCTFLFLSYLIIITGECKISSLLLLCFKDSTNIIFSTLTTTQHTLL